MGRLLVRYEDRLFSYPQPRSVPTHWGGYWVRSADGKPGMWWTIKNHRRWDAVGHHLRNAECGMLCGGVMTEFWIGWYQNEIRILGRWLHQWGAENHEQEVWVGEHREEQRGKGLFGRCLRINPVAGLGDYLEMDK